MTQKTRQERDQEIHDMMGRLSGYIGQAEACDVTASALILQSRRRDDLDLGHAVSIVIYRAKRDLEARGLSIGAWASLASRDDMASLSVRSGGAGSADRPISIDTIADTIVDTRYDDSVDRVGAMHALADRIASLPSRGQAAIVAWLNSPRRADKASSDGRMVYRYLTIMIPSMRARDIWLGYRELSARTGLVIR